MLALCSLVRPTSHGSELVGKLASPASNASSSLPCVLHEPQRYRYYPSVSMDRVILPDEQKALVVQTVRNFETFKAFRARQLGGAQLQAAGGVSGGVLVAASGGGASSSSTAAADEGSCSSGRASPSSSALALAARRGAAVGAAGAAAGGDALLLPPSVGGVEATRGEGAGSPLGVIDSGLVVLLCGPSGTGKTLTVNAVANLLGKRVLLVNFQVMVEPLATRRRSSGEQTQTQKKNGSLWATITDAGT